MIIMYFQKNTSELIEGYLIEAEVCSKIYKRILLINDNIMLISL